MGRRPVRRRRASQKTGRQRVARGSLIAAGFLVSILTGVVLYFLPAIQVALRDTGQANTSLGGNPQLKPVSANESLSSTSPFTLLLLGSDSDSKFKGDYLTQSMILTRVDPVTKHVTMLSIPRDLWVRLCTGGYGKIDQAFLHGGAQCAIQTVEKDLNVHVDYYAWIGLQGLVSVLNDVGGVNVIANNPVMDDYYPADLSGGNPFDYERILVLPGAQHMRRGARARVCARAPRRRLRRLRALPAPAADPDRAARQDQAPLARRRAESCGVARHRLPDQHEHRAGERTAADRGLGAALVDHAGGAAASVHEQRIRGLAGRAATELDAHPSRSRQVLPGELT